MKTPVAFVIFNRPETTERVFEAICQAKPPKLLVVADGPRADQLGEAEQCATTRAIIDRVDWECEVLTNYSETNLGCKKRVSSGLNWVFDIVDEVIVLEDDCVPHPTFFAFCEEMLDRYRNNEQVMSISGHNVQFGRKRTEYSYYFSCYFSAWGWASWKRAWKHYDVEMKEWTIIQERGILKDILNNDRAVKYWTKVFTNTYEGTVKTWAYQWVFAQFIHNSLTVISNTNLICNIGFGDEATNTKNASKTTPYADRPVIGISFPLQHPPTVMANKQADDFTQKTRFDPGWITRVRFKIHRVLGINRK